MNLLFLHGAGGNSNSWICQKRVFGGHYLELHEEGGKKTVEEYADFVKAYVDKRRLTGIVPVGHSMEGAIALMYALKYETERLSEIKVPTLILCGTEDRLAPPHYSRVLAKKIKGSRLHLIEGAGHMVMRERADEFNSEMKKFLE